jgi:putative sterol carrier protein
VNKRPEIPENITHVDYFNQLLKARVNLSPVPKISSLNATIQFEITDSGNGRWNVVVEKGLVKDVTTAFCKKPTCVFAMNSATFLSIIKRKITPQQAFFRGMVNIKGDMFLALKMNILVGYM